MISIMSTTTTTAGATEVQAVVASLKDIEHDACRHQPLKTHDGLACFDFLYIKITENVLRCVDATELDADDPHFNDREFMAVFDVAFADRFLNGIGMGERQTWQPKSWKVLLDRREDPNISPLVFAVAGVNAHVNFDLPFAVVTACMEMGRELDSGTNHDDYQMINQIFAEHMRQLRTHFEGRFLKGFDKARVSRVENRIGDYIVKKARDRAWKTALELWPLRHDEVRMTEIAQSRDRKVADVTRILFALDRIPATAFRTLHRVPGPSRGAARRGLSRTGWAEPSPTNRYQRPR
jgi:Family of unknown function (DUF5995)